MLMSTGSYIKNKMNHQAKKNGKCMFGSQWGSPDSFDS